MKRVTPWVVCAAAATWQLADFSGPPRLRAGACAVSQVHWLRIVENKVGRSREGFRGLLLGPVYCFLLATSLPGRVLRAMIGGHAGKPRAPKGCLKILR